MLKVLRTTRRILEMIRFSHTVFALPFALTAAVLAWRTPAETVIAFRWQDLVGVLLAMVGARSAAMAFNRLADQRLDAQNPRTARRHLPAGELSVSGVWAFTIASVGLYLLGAALFLPNWLPLVIALPVLAILLGYSYAKRFTMLVHFWLGLALGLAPVCVWIAIRGTEVMRNPIDLLPMMLLGSAIMFWVAGFDMIYACQDFEFDRDAGLKSIPAAIGVSGALRWAAVCHAVMLVLLVMFGLSERWGGPPLGLNWPYWTGVAGIGVLLAYEHSLVRPDDLSRVNQAFFHVNAIVSVGLFAVVLIDLFVV